MVMLIQGRDKIPITVETESVTYKHVAYAVVAAAAVVVVAAAAHRAVLGVDSSETTRAGLVQPQIHLAVRHPASFRPS